MTPARCAPGTEQPGLSVAAAARRLGVAPATLRTWDRRYGLGPTGHTPGRHRRYRPDDVARLDLMRRALVRGASPAEAARFAATAALPAPAATATAVSPEPAADPELETHVRLGRVALRLPGVGRRAHGLARAALMLDPVPVRALLAESIIDIGVEATWDNVVRPVLSALSERWSHTGTGVEVEHQLSECVATALGQHAASATVTGDGTTRPVLLAGMPGEQHVLALVALSATLAAGGVASRMLGPSLPIAGLAAAVRRTGPSVVVVWAQVAETADVAALAALPRTRLQYRTFVAGPGWANRALPLRIGRLDTLRDARAAVTEIVSG